MVVLFNPSVVSRLYPRYLIRDFWDSVNLLTLLSGYLNWMERVLKFLTNWTMNRRICVLKGSEPWFGSLFGQLLLPLTTSKIFSRSFDSYSRFHEFSLISSLKWNKKHEKGGSLYKERKIVLCATLVNLWSFSNYLVLSNASYSLLSPDFPIFVRSFTRVWVLCLVDQMLLPTWTILELECQSTKPVAVLFCYCDCTGSSGMVRHLFTSSSGTNAHMSLYYEVQLIGTRGRALQRWHILGGRMWLCSQS